MKKETFADKLAKKSFDSKEMQESWAVHKNAFGPILEPAFVEDYQSRVHLVAALNKISRRDIMGGIKKLEKIQKSCVTDADRAAWLFFMGLAYEMAGARAQMLQCYQEAGTYHHGFYLPYLKVAKAAHTDAAYDVAEENYREAIGCFEGTVLGEAEKVILASAYTNLAACLVMMHRMDEAQASLDASVSIAASQPGREATEALLCAVKGEHERAKALLNSLTGMPPAMLEATVGVVDKIIAGTHPHFYPVEIGTEYIEEFQSWFTEKQNSLDTYLRAESYDNVFALMQPKLSELFPYMERDLEFGLNPLEQGYKISFVDFYMVGLRKHYEDLIQACPEEIAKNWKFEIVH